MKKYNQLFEPVTRAVLSGFAVACAVQGALNAEQAAQDHARLLRDQAAAASATTPALVAEANAAAANDDVAFRTDLTGELICLGGIGWIGGFGNYLVSKSMQAAYRNEQAEQSAAGPVQE